MIAIFTIIESNTYNLTSGVHLSSVNVHSTQYGKDSIDNLGEKIWNLVPVRMKGLKALSAFKNQIRNGYLETVPAVSAKYM